MGRLFWKFFFFIWLGQLTTILGVSLVWILHHSETQRNSAIDNYPPVAIAVDSAVSTLQYGGPDALRELLGEKNEQTIYAVDDAGKDLLGRQVPPVEIKRARALLKNEAVVSTVAQGSFAGKNYLIFHPEVEPLLLLGIQPLNLLPWFRIIVATIASLVFASLLAWYFAKPIRNLRAAFESVAEGNFDIELNSIMGGRRDDLADLGRDFDRMTGQLRALIDGQRRLMHDISHELRSPLARLQVAIGLARQQPEKVESSMVRIERESERMDKLIGELLALSKLDVGMRDSMSEKISLGDLLADIVDDANFEARARGREVELDGEIQATIQGSAELLHRAIENVVRNAIKHTPEHSCVKVNISQESPLQILIAVSDSGPGVSERELEQIFEPFFRGQNARNSAEGHGLGLAIARRVIEAHGGTIQASNLAEGGFRVEMRLPVIASS